MQGQQQYQHQLFHYFDIESLIPQNHLLRKINQNVDLSFVRELTEPFYCQNNGRPSVDPEIFFRIILIGYLYGIDSDRQLCDEIQYNLAYRWFCKLRLEDKVIDHSSLTRIRDRFGLDTFNEFFIKIVEQCKEMGLVKGERIMTDGTLFQANASLDSLVPRNQNEIAEKVKEKSKPGIQAPEPRSISNKTHISSTDPDATLAFKSGTPRTLKYKAHMTIDADSRVVLDTKITTGATHESQVYLKQIETIEEDLKLNVNVAIADRAYGSGDIIQSLIDKKIEPNIPLFSGRSGTNKEPEGFIYNKENNRYECPAGHYLNACPTINNNTITYHSKANDCASCQLKTTCKAKPKRFKKIRMITRHVHKELFDHVKQSMEKELFQKNLVERMWKMEGIISEAKQRHGLSRAKYRGLMKTQIQAYMVASVLNMKRLVAFFILLFIYAQIRKLFHISNVKRCCTI
jgi:transposase